MRLTLFGCNVDIAIRAQEVHTGKPDILWVDPDRRNFSGRSVRLHGAMQRHTGHSCQLHSPFVNCGSAPGWAADRTHARWLRLENGRPDSSRPF